MFYQILKDTAISKVGDYIDVHDDQKAELVKRGMIDGDGVEENPNLAKPAEFVGTPGVTTVAGIVVIDPAKEGDEKQVKEKKSK